ncbi:MAG: hypothetical protein MZW92_11690 [Comamonadaceae bacterium]|nr:hypothetical protein [Comamonadaceae bacterium]
MKPRFHRGLRVTDAAGAGVREERHGRHAPGNRGAAVPGSAQHADGRRLHARHRRQLHHRHAGGRRRRRRLPVHRRGAQGRSRRRSTADLEQENVVLISPVGTSPSGEIFNLSMEEVAEKVAIALAGGKADLPVRRARRHRCQGKAGRSRSPPIEAEMLLREAGAAAPRISGCSCRAASAPRAAACGAPTSSTATSTAACCWSSSPTKASAPSSPARSLARLREATIDDVGAILALIEPLEADGTLVRRGRELLEMEIGRFSGARTRRRHRRLRGALSLQVGEGGRAGLPGGAGPTGARPGYGEELLRHIETRRCARQAEAPVRADHPHRRTGSSSAASRRPGSMPCRSRSAICTTCSAAPRS